LLCAGDDESRFRAAVIRDADKLGKVSYRFLPFDFLDERADFFFAAFAAAFFFAGVCDLLLSKILSQPPENFSLEPV
jgi:hypothetical protein